MFKVFNYRLYPSKAQRVRLEETLETARRFYNDCLGERKAVYELEGRTIGKFEQQLRIKIHKRNNPFAVGVHTHIFKVVVEDLDKAFQAFFRRVKAKKKPGYPRFKGCNRFRSFGLKQPGQGFKIDGRRLRLTFIGRIAVRWHRPLEGKIKTLRITRKADKWYASFCCEVEAKPLPPTNNEVGVDVGLTHLMYLSSGEPIENPRWYRRSQRKLRTIQRRVCRRKLGGSNRRKAVAILSRFAAHVANQRKDFLNKIAHDLISRFDRIALEDLSIGRMVHGSLAKSILDAGWGYFGQRMASKAENAGRTVTLTDPAYTSQDCCICGHRQKLTLKDRWYVCPKCGNSLDRDDNAAQNHLALGRRVWAPSLPLGGLAQEAVPS